MAFDIGLLINLLGIIRNWVRGDNRIKHCNPFQDYCEISNYVAGYEVVPFWSDVIRGIDFVGVNGNLISAVLTNLSVPKLFQDDKILILVHSGVLDVDVKIEIIEREPNFVKDAVIFIGLQRAYYSLNERGVGHSPFIKVGDRLVKPNSIDGFRFIEDVKDYASVLSGHFLH